MAHILLIDDDDILSELLAMSLQLKGHQFSGSANGAEATRMLAGIRPDLIIVDLMMPIMDGLDFMVWLQREMPDAPPVIVLSAATTPEIEPELRAAGALHTFRKPVDLSELVRSIDTVLAAHN